MIFVASKNDQVINSPGDIYKSFRQQLAAAARTPSLGFNFWLGRFFWVVDLVESTHLIEEDYTPGKTKIYIYSLARKNGPGLSRCISF